MDEGQQDKTQDKATMQLVEMCKEDEVLRKENAGLRDRIKYLEEHIAQAHGAVVTKECRPSGH